MQLGFETIPSVDRLALTNEAVDQLISYGSSLQDQYINNTPFPHVVIDGLFSDELLGSVHDEVANMSSFEGKKEFFGSMEKFHTADFNHMGKTTRQFLLDLNSSKFCSFLEALTGIEGLIADQHYFGGGIHFIKPPGFLKMHTDFNWHQKLKIDRRLNMLIYLNKD